MGTANLSNVFHLGKKRINITNCWLLILFKIYMYLLYDVASGSEITPCNKICKPLVFYRFTGTVMTSITTLCT